MTTTTETEIKTKIRIRPMDDLMLVQPIAADDVSPGGVVIPDNAKEKPLRGKVIEVGPGVMLESGAVIPLPVKVGDVVVYGRYAGTELSVEGVPCLMLRRGEVLAIVETISEPD